MENNLVELTDDEDDLAIKADVGLQAWIKGDSAPTADSEEIEYDVDTQPTQPSAPDDVEEEEKDDLPF